MEIGGYDCIYRTVGVQTAARVFEAVRLHWPAALIEDVDQGLCEAAAVGHEFFVYENAEYFHRVEQAADDEAMKHYLYVILDDGEATVVVDERDERTMNILDGVAESLGWEPSRS